MFVTYKPIQRLRAIAGIVVLACSLLASSSGFAAATNSSDLKAEWVKTYPKEGTYERAQQVIESPDGGYLVSVENGWYPDFFTTLMKIDKKGKVKWEKSLEKGFEVFAVKNASKGEFLVVGELHNSGQDLRLIKLDKSGQIDFQRDYPNNHTRMLDVAQTRDGGYVLVGHKTLADEDEQEDMYMVKTDHNGDIQWEKTLGGDKDDWAESVLVTEDDSFVMVGITQQGPGGDEYQSWVHIAKYSKDGDLRWHKTYDNQRLGEIRSAKQTKDNGFIIVGSTANFRDQNDILVLKLDQEGNKKWLNTYDVVGDDRGFDIRQTRDSGYILTSVVGNDDLGSLWYLLQIDASGKKRWDLMFTEIKPPSFGFGIPTSDNGALFGGAQDDDVRLIKVAERDGHERK